MSHPNPSTALARTFVDELVRNGVDRFVIAPGSRSTALALAAVSHPGAASTVAIDERSAGFHALGMAKAGGRPAAVIVTSGTAAANLHPAVVEADLSRTPMVVLTADRPPKLQDVSANQTIDQLHLFGRSVRWFCEVGVAEDRVDANHHWRSTVCRAVADARGGGGPPGPVHLNLAFREPLVPASDDGRDRAEPFAGPTDGRPGGAPWTEVVEPAPAPVPIPDRWLAVEKGVVVAGTVGRPVHELAGQIAAGLGWPLIAEATSGGRPRESITTAHFLAGHAGFVRSHRPEAGLVFGRSDLSRQVLAMLDGAEKLVVDPWGWSDPARAATGIIRGWPQPPAEPIERKGGWRSGWSEAERVVREALDRLLDAHAVPTEPRIARDVAVAVPSGGTLVVASSMPVRDLDMFMAAGDVRVVGNRGASGIDGFVSTALGVSAGSNGPVVALAGDLSILHDQNGFLADPRPDCVFVVVNNDGGGIFSFLPQAAHPEGFERVFGTPHGRDLRHLAALHGVEYLRVEDIGRLAGEVAERSGGGVHLVEVRTDRVENVAVHRELAARLSQVIDQVVDGSRGAGVSSAPTASPGA